MNGNKQRLSATWSQSYKTENNVLLKKQKFCKGSSIYDVTALGGKRHQGLCDDSTVPLILKTLTIRGGV
jgi:hypothetical protein